MRITIVSALWLIGSCWIAGAWSEESAPEQASVRFDKHVREDLFAGFSGNREAMERALRFCEETLSREPRHAEAMVWRGAGRVFMAGQAFQEGRQQDGFQLWFTGLMDLDTAVGLRPDDVSVRIPRAAVLVPAARNAPANLRGPLLDKALADLQKIQELQKDQLDQLSEHSYGELKMGLADVYRQMGRIEDSQEQLRLITQRLPDTEYAERAGRWLLASNEAKLQHSCIGCHEPAQ
jgi:tetratricopeptide (TPR) repeat protein